MTTFLIRDRTPPKQIIKYFTKFLDWILRYVARHPSHIAVNAFHFLRTEQLLIFHRALVENSCSNGNACSRGNYCHFREIFIPSLTGVLMTCSIHNEKALALEIR